MQNLYAVETNYLQIYTSNLRVLTNTQNFHLVILSIQYSQALHYNRICSINRFYNNRCNHLERWLKERRYNEKVVRPGRLPVKIYLTKIPKLRGETNLSLFLLTIQPIQNLKIFPKGKKNRWKILWLSGNFPKPFTNNEGSDTYKVKEGLYLDCNSENVIYLIACKKCRKQCVGSCITRFRTRFNNYRSRHRKFCKGHSVTHVSVYANFMLDGHCSIDDIGKLLSLIKGVISTKLEKKKLFWQFKLGTFIPHGLNEQVVDLEWI